MPLNILTKTLRKDSNCSFL